MDRSPRHVAVVGVVGPAGARRAGDAVGRQRRVGDEVAGTGPEHRMALPATPPASLTPQLLLRFFFPIELEVVAVFVVVLLERSEREGGGPLGGRVPR